MKVLRQQYSCFMGWTGFVVVYDISKDPGSRVVRLQARCISCRVPTMEDVNDDAVYKIAMPSFIANGGDGYEVIRDNKIQHHLTGMLYEKAQDMMSLVFCEI